MVFAVVVAVGLQAAPTAFWRRAGLAYPPFVTLLVVATGHHLFLDAVVAVAVVGAAAGCISVAATVQVGEHLGAARSEVGTALRIGSIRARPRTASRRSPAGSS